MIHHITRATRHLIFWSLILLALAITSVRLALSSVEGYKARLEARVGVMIGAPVKIGKISARIRRFSPEVVLNDINIASAMPGPRKAIELKEIRLGVDLLQAVLSRELLASSWVTLVGVKLTIKRNIDGKVSIAGLRATGGNPLWLLETGKYEVIASEISWQDELRQGRALSFENADLALINQDNRHRLNVRVQLPKKLGTALRVSIDVTGNLFDLNTVSGRAYFEGKHLNLPEWTTVELPQGVEFTAGRSDLALWSEWRQARLVYITGNVAARDLKLRRKGSDNLAAQSLGMDFKLAIADRAWQWDVSKLSLTTGDRGKDKVWPEAVFSIKSRERGGAGSRQVDLYAESLDLQEVGLFGRFFAPLDSAIDEWLGNAALQGRLSDFSLFWDQSRDLFALNGAFADLGLAAVERLPGMTKLTGHITGNRAHGEVRLNSSGTSFIAPRIFRDPLIFDRVDGRLFWQESNGMLSLASPMLAISASGITTQSRFQFRLPKTDAEPFIDIQTEFAGTDVEEVGRYLPAKVMPPHVVAWLEKALLRVSSPGGRFLLSGNPRRFPFMENDGVFEVLFDIEDSELAYHSNWPQVSGVKGNVLFYQNSLHAVAHAGTAYDLNANEFVIDMPELKGAAKVLISGNLDADIDKAFGFLAQTPISERLNRFLDKADLSGKAHIDLNLDIPLKPEGQYQTDVKAAVENAVLKIKPADLTVPNLTGEIVFNRDGVRTGKFTASVLEKPIAAVLQAGSDSVRVTVNGSVEATYLRSLMQDSYSKIIQGGATEYRFELDIPYQSGNASVILTSDLQGIALNMPGLLGKKAMDLRPLTIAAEFPETRVLPLNVSFGSNVSAALHFDAKNSRISSGQIVFGGGKARLPGEKGLAIEISEPQLQLQDWFQVAGIFAGGPASENIVNRINIKSGKVAWGQTDLGEIALNLDKSEKYWVGKIDCTAVRGDIKMPADLRGEDKLEFKLNRIDVSALSRLQMEKAEASPAPGDMPLLLIESKHTFWNGIDLGRLMLQTQRAPHTWVFKRFELQGENEKLSLKGQWVSSLPSSRTQINGRLELIKGSTLFSRLHINDDLVETSGVLDFDFGWQGPPYQIDLAGIQGSAQVDFKDGRILSIEPGFGRVLGVLAMAQWIKRLQLDFSDVYEEGLAFNSINGRFSLSGGIAKTEDLVVDAVPAKITIHGNTDFVKRTVDHVVTVTPKSAEAVPIAGTIMGRFAALIDKTLTGSEHKGFFFGSQYSVKGNWEGAEIRSLQDKEGLFNKTWSGITDFPSLLNPKKN